MPYDRDNEYPLYCRIMGHVWHRQPYPSNPVDCWSRSKSCKRCAHILKGRAEVDARWTAINAAKKAEGCRCGAAGTHVRYGHTVGSVPAEIWTCAEHVNVNSWASSGGRWVPHDQNVYHKGPDGSWVPAGGLDAVSSQWLSQPYEA